MAVCLRFAWVEVVALDERVRPAVGLRRRPRMLLCVAQPVHFAADFATGVEPVLADALPPGRTTQLQVRRVEFGDALELPRAREMLLDQAVVKRGPLRCRQRPRRLSQIELWLSQIRHHSQRGFHVVLRKRLFYLDQPQIWPSRTAQCVTHVLLECFARTPALPWVV